MNTEKPMSSFMSIPHENMSQKYGNGRNQTLHVFSMIHSFNNIEKKLNFSNFFLWSTKTTFYILCINVS